MLARTTYFGNMSITSVVVEIPERRAVNVISFNLQHLGIAGYIKFML